MTTTKEKFIAEIKASGVDPYAIITALVNAVDPANYLENDDLFDVLYQGGFDWPEDDTGDAA